MPPKPLEPWADTDTVGFADLQDFLAALDRDGDLARVRVPGRPAPRGDRNRRTGRCASRARRCCSRTRPAAACRCDQRRSARSGGWRRALGVDDLDEIGERIGELLKPELPRGIGGLRDALGKAAQLRAAPPRRVKTAPCQEIVYKRRRRRPRRSLPGIKAWPDDGGVFLNLGLTHTKHPETGARNLGMYRLQCRTRARSGCTGRSTRTRRRTPRSPSGSASGCRWRSRSAARRRSPTRRRAPLPADIDEYLFAGFLQRERVELVDCVTVPLQVPAAAQVVLEGWVEPGERLPEGPFGDHTGFYTPVEPFPFLRVETMTMRADAIYQSIIVGRPPQEDGPIGKATERIFLPLIRLTIPEIVDYDLPEAGVFHNCVIVSIDKRFPKHAQKVMNAIWGAGLLSLSKLIVVVDADCDVHDYAEVAWRAFGNVDYAHDVLHTVGPVDHLDHASYEQFWGGKLGRRRDPQAADRGLPAGAAGRRSACSTTATTARVERRWREYGIGRWQSMTDPVAIRCDVDLDAAPRRDRRARWRASAGPEVPAPGDDRALGLRAAVRLHRRADRDVARRPARCTGWQLLLITVAMVAARTVAMSANRILDRDFDALNPRTAKRELVTGELIVRTAWIGTVVALVIFLAAAAALSLAVPGAGAARGCAARPLLVRQAVHRLPAGAARAGPVRRPGRGLARRHRPSSAGPAVRARASPSAPGSAASTSSTPARTPRSTGGSARARSRRGSAFRRRCARRRSCTS